MITISILLAFELDQWNDRRNTRETMKQYEMALKEDLRHDLRELEETHADQVNRQVLIDNVIRDPNLLRIDSIYHKVMDSHTFYPKTGTYNALKSTGEIRLLGDHGFRQKLSNLHEYLFARNQVLAAYSDDMILNHEMIWHEANIDGQSMTDERLAGVRVRILREELDISKEYTDWLKKTKGAIVILIDHLNESD